MSKIRNLFKKFKKKKSGEDSTGEHDISQFDEDDIDVFDDDADILEENDHAPIMATEDRTGDIPVANDLDDEIKRLDAEINEIEEDETGEIYIEDYLTEDHTGTGTLDLENGKVPLKDRARDALESFKAAMPRFKMNRPKKMTIKKKSDDNNDNTKSIKINLPPTLKNVEGKVKDKLKQVNWKNIHNEFFQRSHRQAYHRSFQILAIVLVTYSFGKTTGLLLKGQNSYKNMKKNAIVEIDQSNELTARKITELKNAKLFKTQAVKESTGTKKPVIRNDIACTKAARKSKLPITLVNTIVMQDSVKSIASVQVRASNELLELRQSEKISTMATVGRIERLRLIVKNLQDGSCEYIENEKAEKVKRSSINVMSPKQSVNFKKQQKKIKGIENEGNSFVIDKKLIQDKMANIQDILTQARGIQITNPDGSISFKIVDIQPGGIFSYLGINNNDIITQINGQPITDLNMVMGLFGKITNLNKLNLTVKRNGTETPLDYKFR